MKKILCIVVSIVLLLSAVCSVSAYSVNILNIGETMTVKVTLNNEKAFSLFGLSFEYDHEALETVSGNWLIKNALVKDFDQKNDKAALMLKDDTVVNGEVFEIAFKVKENAYSGDYKIIIEPTLKSDDGTVSANPIEVRIVIDGKERPVESSQPVESSSVSSSFEGGLSVGSGDSSVNNPSKPQVSETTSTESNVSNSSSSNNTISNISSSDVQSSTDSVPETNITVSTTISTDDTAKQDSSVNSDAKDNDSNLIVIVAIAAGAAIAVFIVSFILIKHKKNK